MTNPFHWKLIHILSTGSHIGIFIAGFVTFAYLGSSTEPPDVFTREFQFSIALSWASAVVGGVGAAFNGALMRALLKVQNPGLSSTEEDRYGKKQLAFSIGCIVGFLISGVDFGLAAALRPHVQIYEVIAGPYTFAILSGILMLATVCADARVFLKERKEYRVVMGYDDDTASTPDGEIRME